MRAALIILCILSLALLSGCIGKVKWAKREGGEPLAENWVPVCPHCEQVVNYQSLQCKNPECRSLLTWSDKEMYIDELGELEQNTPPSYTGYAEENELPEEENFAPQPKPSASETEETSQPQQQSQPSSPESETTIEEDIAEEDWDEFETQGEGSEWEDVDWEDW